MSRLDPSIVTGTSPAARASSNAIMAPSLMASPVRLAGPVNGPMTPILTGSPASPASCARNAEGMMTIREPTAPKPPTVSRKSRRERPSGNVGLVFLPPPVRSIIALPTLRRAGKFAWARFSGRTDPATITDGRVRVDSRERPRLDRRLNGAHPERSRTECRQCEEFDIGAAATTARPRAPAMFCILERSCLSDRAREPLA